MAGTEWIDSRVTLAINLQLKPGRSGASARVELHVRPEGSGAVVRVQGRLDRVALERLAQTLEDLASRGVRDLMLDASQLGDLRIESIDALMSVLTRFQARSGEVAVCGLPHELRDRVRSAGLGDAIESRPRSLARVPRIEDRPSREWAS